MVWTEIKINVTYTVRKLEFEELFNYKDCKIPF